MKKMLIMMSLLPLMALANVKQVSRCVIAGGRPGGQCEQRMQGLQLACQTDAANRRKERADKEIKVAVDGIEWTYVITNGTARVDAGPSTLTRGSIVIPSLLGGCPVTGIGEYAFGGCSNLTSVTIPSSVTYIGKAAFDSCCGLKSMTIPTGVKQIGAGAFYGCYGLESVVLPPTVTHIETSAFYGCCMLVSIEMPDGVTRIGAYAFSDCSGLKSVRIPPTVTSLEDSIFAGCAGLGAVTIPQGVTNVGAYVFSDCGGLEVANIPPSVISIGDGAFVNCRELKSVTISPGVKCIGEEAFAGCSTLGSVTIPPTVMAIGKRAFSDTLGLTRRGMRRSGTGTFYDNLPDGMVILGGGVLYEYRGKCPSLVTIPSNVTCIGDGAFSGRNCNELKSVIISPSVKRIGNSAFSGCWLTSVVIPEGVTSIGCRAFQNCRLLTSVVLPSSVRRIEEGAFLGCHDLESVKMCGECPGPHNDAFMSCAKLAKIHVPMESQSWTGMKTWQGIPLVFDVEKVNCQEARVQDALDGVAPSPNRLLRRNLNRAQMARWAITGRRKLESTSGVRQANVDGFNWSFSVTGGEASIVPSDSSQPHCAISPSTSGHIIIPSMIDGTRVTSIGDSAFSLCQQLTEVTIPSGVMRIGMNAFYGCSKLSSVVIPASVTNIGCGAFTYCRRLTSLVVDQANPNYCSVDGVLCSKDGRRLDLDEKGEMTSVRCDIKDRRRLRPIKLCAAEVDGYTWSYSIEGGVAKILAMTGGVCYCAITPKPIGHVTIPSELGGMTVTGIGRRSFADCNGVTSVTIPLGVKYVEDEAFECCSELTTVTIPEGVTCVGRLAFSGCSGLRTVTIPSSLTDFGQVSARRSVMGRGAFEGCRGLKSFVVDEKNPKYSSVDGLLCSKNGQHIICGVNGDVTIPSCVTSIGNSAFQGCAGLLSVTIPSSVTSIGMGAFYECSGLASVAIPPSVTSLERAVFADCSGLKSVAISPGVAKIAKNAFLGCNALTSFVVDEANAAYSSINGMLCSKDGRTLVAGVNGDVTIPSNVTKIAGAAFLKRGGLHSVTIPSSVKDIGDGERAFGGSERYAFGECDGLMSFMVDEANTVYRSFNGLLCSKDGRRLIIGVNGNVTIPSNVTTIASSAFSGCKGLTSVTIPSSVTNIGSYAFSRCSGLTSVTIPSTVTDIDCQAFGECVNLKSIDVVTEGKVKSLSIAAFLKRYEKEKKCRDVERVELRRQLQVFREELRRSR